MATGQRSATTSTGREIEVPARHTWVSIESVRDDLSAATGQNLPRHVIKHALIGIEAAGHVRSSLMFPETRGRYGKLYQIADHVLEANHRVDPVMEYRIHTYGDVTAFTHGAIAAEDAEFGWKQRQPGDVRKLMDFVAKNGSNQSLFRTVGMWSDRRNVREVKKPVFMPWIVLDIDVPGDLYHAHEVTLGILSDLEDAGFDLERCFASFSGSKGFHIAIPTDHFGSPIFKTSDLARECMINFVRTFTDHKFDPATLSPLQMLRLTGSKHSKTGIYKKTWTVPRFRSLRLDHILDGSKKFESWQYPDPTVGEIEIDIMSKFERAAKQTAQNDWSRVERSLREGENSSSIRTIGKALAGALAGVRQGQDWAAGKSGRDSAAFTVATFCYSDHQQHEAVRRSLGMTEPEFVGEPFEDMMNTLKFWNQRNEPPLSDREIGQKVRSAIRYIDRRR